MSYSRVLNELVPTRSPSERSKRANSRGSQIFFCKIVAKSTQPDRPLLSLFRKDHPVIIRPYGGFANDTHFFVKARILEDKGIAHLETDGVLRTVDNFFKRMGSEEKVDVEVKAKWSSGSTILRSDREGYVSLNTAHHLGENQEAATWIDLELYLKNAVQEYRTTTRILRPGVHTDFGIISDIDDTIIHTGVASRLKWRLLVNSIARHPYARRPVKGVRDFYQALHKGKSGSGHNPIFYVSNSPWNLYSYLRIFLDHHHFPKGPLILRDIGIKPMEHTAIGGKYGRIREIIEAFPTLRFVLFGDSAEVDTDIYLQLSRDFPEQIHSIFIRCVSNKKRLKRVKELIEANRDIQVRLIYDSAEGLAFAKELNLL